MANKNDDTLIQQAQALLDTVNQAESKADHSADKLLSLSKQTYQQGELRYSRQLAESARLITKQQAEQLLTEAKPDASKTLALTTFLTDLDEYALARKLLQNLTTQGCSEEIEKTVAHQLSLNTYQDDELSPDSRYEEALTILDSLGLRNTNCKNPETLGQAGAIYKLKFDRSGRIEDLQAAYYFYQRGWSKNPPQDMGYCGINAAYILDLLAHRAHIGAALEKIHDSDSAKLRKQARALREDILAKLPTLAEERDIAITQQWWFLVTMAETAFGLGLWEEATKWLKQAKNADHFEWEHQAVAKQLVAIARLHGFVPPADKQAEKDWAEPWQALAQLLGADARAAFESFRGKVGLALSGGGFRASLYHLGMLARLAEVDALRSVEVLSTVSGGSIVGAHYYLALRKMLMNKTDEDMTRDDYINLVRNVIEQFFAGISENLRVRALSSLPKNFKILFETGYGRSNRMGELYESYLFDKAETYQSKVTAEDSTAGMRPMHGLRIHPLTTDPASHSHFNDTLFRPKYANWRRRSKIPTLLLNTTSLNSGHNWHFTASWMGEPPGLMGQDIDMNQRYRRLYYWQAPNDNLKNYPLGYAVAASAGVPTLFDPLELGDLYPDHTIRLVDGGVHDNQGVAGLLDESCNLILCSDASGQMDDQKTPAKSALSVFLRSDSILQDRVREAQYQELEAKAKSNAIQGLFFIHLKQELETDTIDWIKCDNPSVENPRPPCTRYGIDRSQQHRLAEIRTDLDTFTEVEAYALMASGYAMTKHQLSKLDQLHQDLQLNGSWADFDIHAPEQTWAFSKLLPILATDPTSNDAKARDLADQLGAAKMIIGKAWHLIPWLRYTGYVCGLALFAGLIFFLKQNWQDQLTITLGIGGITSAIVLTVVGLLLPFGKYLQPLDVARKWVGLVVLATVGWALANLHLETFDKLFKERGKLQRLLDL